MPGSPATTPRHAIPRYGDLDAADIGAIANSISDRLDVTAPIFGSGLLSARPSTGAGIADRYYYATDAVRPDGSTGVLYRDAGGASPTWSAVTPVAPRTISTVLPGSPVTGQEILFQDTTVLGPANIVWPLRYDGTKWVPIGCTPLYVGVDTSESTTATNAYQDLATVGPQITIPVAGDYLFDFRSTAQCGTVAFSPVIGLSIAGAAPGTPTDDVVGSGAAGNLVVLAREIKKTGVGAAATARVRYAPGAAAVVQFQRRSLKVTPFRLG